MTAGGRWKMDGGRVGRGFRKEMPAAAGGRCVPKIEKIGGRNECSSVVVIVGTVTGAAAGECSEGDAAGHFCGPITVT